MTRKILKNRKGNEVYTITENGSKYPSFRIVLNGSCGFHAGQEVAQVLRDDGILELWPIERLNEIK